MKLNIDSASSSVEFAIKNLFVSTVKGHFADVSGLLDLDHGQPEKSSIHAEIRTASVDTHDKKRNAHLRNADFFDVDTYPIAVFDSKHIKQINEQAYQVTGDLTLHGITKEVALDVKKLSAQNGNSKQTFEANTVLDRNEFGIKWGSIMIGRDANLKIIINAIPQ
ncbi:polyisoprenoid-binding protein [Dictyobacter vulcani]|uniref:Polyisoprenoid-binding protein n=1 Tax=Dictyobacter vulcani TaxID=2607529 RepID=A0A5J4KUL1_9CHLR|nr:YceI family protein [Dictyobacter vulcani]GER90170.1 polyisoprenoid-binding protein [Dictyobacter vulcani]